MGKEAAQGLFGRRSLDQITEVPDSIISVYVVENHIWAKGGSNDARANREPQLQTVEEFLIDPVRPFLNDVFRQLAAPHNPDRKDNPIGQGYWIQAEFGSGKSHLLSFVGALALGNSDAWEIVRDKEQQAGQGRRESLYSFYENGLEKKTKQSKGIFVAVKTLVGQGGGAVGIHDAGKTLTEYVLDAVAEQFYLETGKSLPLYPTQKLAQRFLTEDFERYQQDLARYLKDSRYFDEEEQEDLEDFLKDLQNNPDPGVQRDCGQRLWDFYERYLQTRPRIPVEVEDVLHHMVQLLLDEGYAGLLLILDEVSLFMKGRSDSQRVEDEKALVVLSNRLAKVENLPVWLICAAQQAIESKMAGVKNIIARERLDLVPLLNDQADYYDIALSRVRTITDEPAIDQYYEDYRRSFSWPQAVGRDEFARFFPFYPPSLSVVRAVSLNLTTVRSALYFMLQTLKTQRKRKSRELITLWALFDDVIDYEEDPSGTTKGVASIKTKWPAEWAAYERAKQQLDTVTSGPLKVYRSRAEKIIKTLFLYHVANMATSGLAHEELMNSVMEWRDHDADQKADLPDNLDHYEILADKIALELAQVVKAGQNYKFNPTGSTTDPRDHYQRARAEVEQSEVIRRQAWEALLALDGWNVDTGLMKLDMAHGVSSIFREIAPGKQTDVTIKWHGREITGRVFMRDLLDISKRGALLPSINSPETGLDYAVFISSTPAVAALDSLIKDKKDGRILFWSPDELSPAERDLLNDWAAYRTLVAEFSGRDTQEAQEVLNWVQARLREEIGTIYRIVPDSYNRGQVAALDHSEMAFEVRGELPGILTPLVEQVLDTVYVSKDLEFAAPAPFNDTNAVNTINGIVKVGEIPRGAKPTRDISAAQNYGFDLQIMRRPNDRKLDPQDCRYTRDIFAWIEEKLGDTNSAIPATTVYKNFMGIGGPGGIDYGLSKRMVQLYLLCLVREGRIRISLSGKNLPFDTIDYSNIADVDFRVAVLDAFDQIQRLKPPEGWELLAPFAAILLKRDELRAVRQDADIQQAVHEVLRHKQDNRDSFHQLRSGIDELFQEIGQANPLEERLGAWEYFLTCEIDPGNAIPFLLNALDQAFGYRVYADSAVRQQDLDDFSVRCEEVRQAEAFYAYRDRVRAVANYVRAAGDMPADREIAGVVATLQDGADTLLELSQLIANQTALRNELLEPVEDAIETYQIRYLQVFDQVTAQLEQARQAIAVLDESPEYIALGHLAAVEQLGSDPRPGLQFVFDEAMQELAALFDMPAPSRVDIERELRTSPFPRGCRLTLANAGEWSDLADIQLNTCNRAVWQAILDRATLLQSQAFRERLEQGRDDPFIAGLLATETTEDAATYLVEALGGDANQGAQVTELLARYLKMLTVRKLRFADFAPSKRTLERGDVDTIVEEFRMFLLSALEDGGDDELPVVELE